MLWLGAEGYHEEAVTSWWKDSCLFHHWIAGSGQGSGQRHCHSKVFTTSSSQAALVRLSILARKAIGPSSIISLELSVIKQISYNMAYISGRGACSGRPTRTQLPKMERDQRPNGTDDNWLFQNHFCRHGSSYFVVDVILQGCSSKKRARERKSRHVCSRQAHEDLFPFITFVQKMKPGANERIYEGYATFCI
jgi:hypothetical protein